MQGVIKLSQIFVSNKERSTIACQNKDATDPILAEIDSVLKQLDATKARFNFETESEMIDSCIFQEHALLSRYSYLLSVAKKRGLRCEYRQNLQHSR